MYARYTLEDVRSLQVASGSTGVCIAVPADTVFDLVKIPTPPWRGSLALDWWGDADADWALVARIANAYRVGHAVMSPVYRPDDQGDGGAFLDGNHRWAAAWLAGLPQMIVYQPRLAPRR